MSYRYYIPIIVLILAMAWSPPSRADCNIDLRIRNVGSGMITFYPPGSKSKSKGGTWRKLDRGGWFANRQAVTVLPGETSEAEIYLAKSRCRAQRRFIVPVSCQINPRGWSQNFVGWMDPYSGDPFVDASQREIEHLPVLSNWTRSDEVVIDAGRFCLAPQFQEGSQGNPGFQVPSGVSAQ